MTNDTNTFLGFDYNFKSGFGNFNDAADSLGSFFGFGPQDRNEVLSNATEQMKPEILKVYNAYNNSGIDYANQLITKFIDDHEKYYRKYKSANTKASIRHKIDMMKKVKTSLLEQDIKIKKDKKAEEEAQNKAELISKNTSSTLSSNSSLIFGLGFLLVVLKYTKILK